ncbi:hypothetical protein [Bradyrhizobium liaoningense]|uniref:hypothetical protein n=1 Tax=Bradyrhizobium liaoningense TaxID=43992 RepID=UPI001BABAEE7|nr:hypothetical protein [Bradyrhizobium liaoningense]MBR0984578.1 hypothetical protein [Bradyrhizobium liaoningense]
MTRAGQAADPAYGLIINADCDLVHCKIDGVVSYLPVYSFSYFFERFWIPNYVKSRRLEILASIRQVCGLQEDKHNSLVSWIREDEAKSIAERLSKTYKIKASTFLGKIEELQLIERSDFFDCALLERLIKVQGLEWTDTVQKLARRALKNIGEGHFFINEIAGLQEIGFVVRMTRIYGIDADDVFSSRPQLVIAGDQVRVRAVRIAKLTNVYRFKIAQLFAYQFSRIGLPDEITELNEVAVQAAVFEMGRKR